MKSTRKAIPYLIISTAGMYLLPIIGTIRTGSTSLALYLTPVFIFALAFCFGLKHGFRGSYSIIIAILSLPWAFLFFGSLNITHILICTFIAAALALAGNYLGAYFHKKKSGIS